MSVGRGCKDASEHAGRTEESAQRDGMMRVVAGSMMMQDFFKGSRVQPAGPASNENCTKILVHIQNLTVSAATAVERYLVLVEAVVVG